MICGEFHEFGLAYYHSAVNYTTLGYGDVIMTRGDRQESSQVHPFQIGRQ
jgi:hypothetical protein